MLAPANGTNSGSNQVDIFNNPIGSIIANSTGVSLDDAIEMVLNNKCLQDSSYLNNMLEVNGKVAVIFAFITAVASAYPVFIFFRSMFF